ncbi:MAG TPA: NB-ARC domain-containing protein [Ktedonobacteraceae bacterium]|nr:NB-ARC domain-containing protein [Ktedonobacteraceae bacterium]
MTTGEGAYFQHPPNSSANLALFREKITAARRPTGHIQKELAVELGIESQVLSRKLHGANQTYLTHEEVKRIIKKLAGWDAITTQFEAIELLALMGLRPESFSDEEWNAAPLNRLEPAPHNNVPDMASSFAALSAYAPVPAPSTSLIGRETLVQALLERLRQPSVRLLTLLGTGGVGKTRLALEVTHAARQDFADGVFFVSLATIRDAVLVPSTIVQALRLSEPVVRDNAGGQGISSREDLLKGFLRDKSLLLVLDNVEQIPAIAPFINDLLGTAPCLKVMVTSRSVLRLYGEHEFDVPPLEVCAPDHVSDAGYVAQFPANRLFVERAQAVHPAFHLSESNAATIAQICARLDGLPLAIELAAARTKMFSLPTILQRLTDGKGQGLAFLRSSAHNVLQRHQTLLDTLNWSYGLLDEQQQCLFRRLSVFLGGWTLDAIEAIVIEENEDASQDDALDLMEALLDRSLVKRMLLEAGSQDEGTEPRFYFLETIREYALGRLEACGERENVQRLHAEYYLAMTERIEPNLYGRRQSEAVSMLAREQDNLRAALEWAIGDDEVEVAQRLCGALGMFWEARTSFQEAHRWIDVALIMTDETSPSIRAKLLMSASRIALWEIACERSRELAEQALALYEAVGDEVGKTSAIFQIGDSWHMQGEYALAIPYLEESALQLREQGDLRTYAFALSRLGAMAILQNNFPQAWTWLNEALPLLREYSEPGLLNVTLVYLGVLAMVQGDLNKGVSYLREGLLLAQQTGNRYMLASDLIAFGCLLGTTGGPSYAARICSAAEALFASLNTALPAAYGPLYNAYLGSIKFQANEATWETWWAEGKVLSQEEVTMLAMEASE